jgi:putative cardiolipin synthase
MNGFLRSIALALACLSAGCASLPPPEDRIASTALPAAGHSPLEAAVSSRAASHPGLAGIHALPIPIDAFAARALLAGAAERSIDAQYYIWHGDNTGYLLFEALRRAAERGVRVRLLLDDLNTAGLDPVIAALDAHPNIEVRLYNPLVYRTARVANYVFDFARANRRMHNKAFIVDNAVAVVGGRNIADEYLGTGSDVVFADLDVMAVGPVVGEVSGEFDLYWNSASAYPAAALLGPRGVPAADLAAKLAEVRADPQSRAYASALRDTPLLKALLAGHLAFDWVHATALYDDPAKTLDSAQRTDVLLLPQLLESMGRPQRSFDLVSPYFVPGDKGTDAIAALAKRGVRVRVLTNSLAATDVVAVHAGYAKRRRELLEAGVALYELKPTAVADDPDDKAVFGLSSSSSLHAKTFAVDGERIFVGSFNTDQRSAHLNTEMGLVIASPALAQRLGTAFDDVVPRVAYEVRLTPDGSLEWLDRTPRGVTRFTVEPGTRAATRGLVELLSILPIEWLL